MYKVLITIIIIFSSFKYANAQIAETLQVNSAISYTNKCRVEYAHIDKEITKIYQYLPKNKWKGIITIARGGLYPALILAHKLDINKMDLISLTSYYKDKAQGDIKLLQDFNFNNKNQGEGWIVVDDLVDSGKTIKWLNQYLPKAYYIVVYAKPRGAKLVDKHGMKIPQTTWITFPWDNEFSLEIPECIAL
ncbi:xanthine phosphoribosyltransferase [Rickettsia endosymbiont of Pantilius tunicatus]|uniref:xanthine phosphoribosyltransferase n=1 Tax=Rickettsia endosymbiont of Pantilius tunicatus TaxID=3066267 RepID=UPI00376F3828